MFLCHTKLEKTDMLMLFCLTLVLSLPRHSFSSLHSASVNAFKSSRPGKRATFMLVEHTVCFGQLPNLLPSLLCVTLCGLSFCLSASLFSLKLQNRKTQFSKSGCCIGGWPTPTARAFHKRSDGRKNICFISILVDKLKQRH